LGLILGCLWFGVVGDCYFVFGFVFGVGVGFYVVGGIWCFYCVWCLVVVDY